MDTKESFHLSIRKMVEEKGYHRPYFYIIGQEDGDTYCLMWVEKSAGKNDFLERYKRNSGREHMILPPNFTNYLSYVETWYKFPIPTRIHRIPSDITDEEIQHVVENDCKAFAGHCDLLCGLKHHSFH